MKNKRQEAILNLVRTKEIFTQAELTQGLKEAGFSAAQATISRDIQELRLAKEPTPRGQKYTAPDNKSSLNRIFKDGVVSVNSAGNMMVVRTLSGLAMAVALALDEMKFVDILGSVAGDDVVICVVTSEARAREITAQLSNY